jgi:hypothetical protein
MQVAGTSGLQPGWSTVLHAGCWSQTARMPIGITIVFSPFDPAACLPSPRQLSSTVACHMHMVLLQKVGCREGLPGGSLTSENAALLTIPLMPVPPCHMKSATDQVDPAQAAEGSHV